MNKLVLSLMLVFCQSIGSVYVEVKGLGVKVRVNPGVDDVRLDTWFKNKKTAYNKALIRVVMDKEDVKKFCKKEFAFKCVKASYRQGRKILAKAHKKNDSLIYGVRCKKDAAFE